jgi:hypothetical protein
MKELPIGTQSFEVLRTSDFVYVDKTEHIWNLVNKGRMYFLSRPRRFGKSLLVSALSELFGGKKELFNGLYIYDRWDWSKTFPVIYLDFSEITYSTTNELKLSLNKFIEITAEANEIIMDKELPLSMKFAQLIEQLHKKTGNPVVILVDEYDKPLIDSLSKPKETQEEIKTALHDFYQVIKAKDKYIKFVLLTGVSRFSGLSIFSGLNNLNDITMNYKYATICGYTQEELEAKFKEHIKDVGKYLKISYEETLGTIKCWYNGYSWDGKASVYNPFSTLMFLENKKFKDYWYKTGTPTFLIKQIVKKNGLDRLIGQGTIIISSLSDVDYDMMSIVDLLFQTGYLTIKKEEIREDKSSQYLLDFPNMEVREAFLSSLLAAYVNRQPEEIGDIAKRVNKGLKEKDGEVLREALTELFANIGYDLHIGEEKYYHSIFLATGKLLGFEVNTEVHTDKGRIDAVLKKEGKTTIVEIKYGEEVPTKKLVEEAIEQIKEKRYYEKYGKMDVSLLGIGFGNGKEIGCEFEELK